MKLGKRPARRGAVSFTFRDFFNPDSLPKPPEVFGHYFLGSGTFGVLGNDQYSDCVFAGAAHETMIWSKEGGREVARFTEMDVLDDYAAVTGFNPADPATDQGTDMQTAASYRRKTGVRDASNRRHTIDSYVALSVGDVDELVLATWLTGASGVGLQFPAQSMTQFKAGQVWTVPTIPKMDGGHYVPCVGRNSAGNLLVITWGRLQAMTPAYYQRFSDEALAYISLEILNAKNLSPEGFDADGLRAQLAKLNGTTST
jgi:hypothetical protein